MDIETDWQLYDGVFSQDLTATQVYMFCLLSAVSNRFEDEACTVLTFPYINFWTVSSDGWSTPDALGNTVDMLYELQTEWADASSAPSSPPRLGNRPSGATGRLAHFVGGAALGGGVAYRGVLSYLCYQYDVSANIDGGVTGFPRSAHGVRLHELGLLRHRARAGPQLQRLPHPPDLQRRDAHRLLLRARAAAAAAGLLHSQSCISTGAVMSYCHLCPGA